METSKNREFLMAGAYPGRGDRSDELRRYYTELLPEVAPSLEERVEWLLQEVLRLRSDHAAACRLAWGLYLAGMGHTGETIQRIERDPVEAVRQAVSLVAAGVLTPGGETRNVIPDVRTSTEEEL